MFGQRKAVRPKKSIFDPSSLPSAPPVSVPNRPPAEIFEFPTVREDSLFKAPAFAPEPPRKRRKAPKSIEFDSSSRREFLTGFHKRKVERTNARKERAKEREKAERKEERRERRGDKERRAAKVLEKIERVRDVVAGKRPVEELEEDDDQDDGDALGSAPSEDEGTQPKRKQKDGKRSASKRASKEDSVKVFRTPHSVTTVTTVENLDLDDFLEAAGAETLDIRTKPTGSSKSDRKEANGSFVRKQRAKLK
ncbi:nucleolar protein 12-domain-containing protein [Hyaloraphidium curvatum]|nr:nucleolar protein 12-domain-containing protein [Hyaloraphidium curvatum]